MSTQAGLMTVEEFLKLPDPPGGYYELRHGEAVFVTYPDLVVEVLSPTNSMDEMNDRMAICLDNGCSSFWVVDEKRKRLSVTEGNLTHHYGINDSFHCDVIGATVHVRDIFA
jgi:Uma2 family endonuclease